MTLYNGGNYRKHKTGNPLKRHLVERMDKKLLELVGISVSIRGGQKLLDAGCGEGFTLRKIEDAYGTMENLQLYGIDYANEAIAIAKKMTKSAEYLQGSLYELPYEDKSFDVVICSEVLEHLESPAKACLELIRVSKGTIIITVPHEPWFCLGNLCALKNVSRLGNDIEHINHWTGHSFVNFIKEHFSDYGQMEFSKSFPWQIAVIRKRANY